MLAGGVSVPGLSASVIVDGRHQRAGHRQRAPPREAVLRVEIGDGRDARRLFDKRAGREILAGRGNQIWAYGDKPRNWDAWDIEEDYPRQRRGNRREQDRGRRERPAPRGACGSRAASSDSTIVQTVRLWANSARLEFRTDIDWHERRILLKARFPLAIRSDHATFECAAGVVRRPTHRNTSWDEARFEVAAPSLRRSLRARLRRRAPQRRQIRASRPPQRARAQPAALAGLPRPARRRRAQSFTYALYPHPGDWLSGGVLAEAEDLNQPLLARVVKADAPSTWRPPRSRG